MNNLARTVASAVAVIGISLSYAAPSFAVAPRTFPDGDTYYAVPCDFSNNSSDYSLNIVNSDGTTEGLGSTERDGVCAADGSYNVTDGYYYAYSWFDSQYFKMNVENGEITLLGDLTYPGGAALEGDADSTFVDNAGNHYFFYDNNMFLIDMSDMTTTSITDSLGIAVDGGQSITSVARNPVDGKYYLITDGDIGHLFELTLSSGAVVDLGAIDECTSDLDCWGLDFDSDGVIWIQRDEENADSDMVATLYSTTIDALNSNWVLQGTFTDPSTGDWYGESTFILHANEEADPTNLAETGFEATLPAGIAAALALAGAVLMTRRRRS